MLAEFIRVMNYYSKSHKSIKTWFGEALLIGMPYGCKPVYNNDIIYFVFCESCLKTKQNHCDRAVFLTEIPLLCKRKQNTVL